MASITDCVVEGLKYPFNDIKKVICLGVLFAILNMVSIARGITSLDIVRAISRTSGKDIISQIPQGDMYVMILLAIVALIVILFIMGYQYAVVKFSIDKKEELPGFGDILTLFKNGIKYFIVTVAYNIIPILVMFAGVALINSCGQYLIFVSMILFIIAYFLLIMALNNMVAHDNLAKAFDFRQITDKIANLGWGKYIGIIIFTLIVFMIIMAAVGFVLSIITVVLAQTVVNQAIVLSVIIGVIEGLFVNSYCSVFFSRVLGSVYREAIK